MGQLKQGRIFLKIFNIISQLMHCFTICIFLFSALHNYLLVHSFFKLMQSFGISDLLNKNDVTATHDLQSKDIP